MNLQMSVLCDAATDYSGKLNVLGTFDTIFSGQFPALHPQCSLALRILFNKMEEGRHQLEIGFVDEDGKPLMPPIPQPLEIIVPGDATFISRNFVVNIQGLKLDRPGLYSFYLSVDGRHEASIPLAVKQITAPQPK